MKGLQKETLVGCSWFGLEHAGLPAFFGLMTALIVRIRHDW
ncbi:hypothetical protein [Pseudovibrio sp. W64]|nr:hypothetical protein [Pseudovibrio sp. W64]